MNKENRKKQSCGDAKLMWSIVFGLTRLCPGGGHGHGRAAVNLRRTERKKERMSNKINVSAGLKIRH